MKSIRLCIITCILVVRASSIKEFFHTTDFKPFEDAILHKIHWIGKSEDKQDIDSNILDNSETILMTSLNQEKYRCTLPMKWEEAKDSSSTYQGPNPIQLLEPLFTQKSCSYRLDSYWTYELCHGRYIRQYHEDREGRKSTVQEYILGKWTKEELDELSSKLDQQKNREEQPIINTKKIEGMTMPYLQVNMSGGTLCDINGKSRMVQVLYVCFPHGKHEVYSLDELSTCEYEIVVLSQLLCEHPQYRPTESTENEIRCYAMEGAPSRPQSLTTIEIESLKQRHENLMSDLDNLEAQIKGEGWPIDVTIEAIDDNKLKVELLPPSPAVDSKLIEDFLSGQQCLTGGTGWWKYEYCHKQRVDQFHEEKGSQRIFIHLGFFNYDKHIDWLSKNPHKRPKPKYLRKVVSHFYSDGSTCELTAKPRQVEVRLKCVDKGTPNSVALYLLEPHTCEYVLGVESSFLCSLIESSDENGLFDITKETVDDDENLAIIEEENPEE